MKVTKAWQAVAIFGGFGLIGLIPVIVTFYESISLMHAIQHQATHIAFDKGIYYLFGGGLIFFLLPIWLLLLYIYNPSAEKSKKIQRIVVTFFGVCVISMPVLPQVMSISVGHYLEKRGYEYCDNLSSQWLFTRTMVYQKGSCQPISK